MKMVLTEAPSPRPFAVGQRWFARWLARVEPFRHLQAMAARPDEAPVPCRVNRRHHAPSATWFLVLGSPGDGKAFTCAVRAFALAGRLGDHLILVGYGQRRRSLEKWVRALRIERAVTFAGAAVSPTIDTAGCDVAIVISQAEGRSTLRLGTVSDEGARRCAGVLGIAAPPDDHIASGDVVALCHAMVLSRRSGAASA